MFKDLRYNIAKAISSEYRDGLKALDIEQSLIAKEKKNIEEKANQRVSEILLQMDPFEPLMKKYNGVFSREYEFPEEKLTEQGKIGMYMWGFQQNNDIHFEFMVDYIMNTAGNSLLKRGDPTSEKILYARAQIANMVLFRREVGRLSSNYEEMLKRKGREEFDPSVGVEE